jgi:Ribonuclease G/E
VSRRILVAASPGENRVAVLAEDELEEFAIDRPGMPDGVGDIHRARVVAHLPAMAGAFLRLADAADGFLPDSEGGAGLAEGAAVTVRVTRAAQGGKGPRLTARLSPEDSALGGAGTPALLRRGPTAVGRVASRFPEAPVLVDDASLLASLLPALGARLCLVRHAFDDAVEGEIAALALPEAELPGGMRAHFAPTPALVAIDLDTGAASAERRAKPAAQLAANRAALPELARQIRLRNLSGAILLDFAGLSPRRRASLGAPLAAALAADPLQPRLLGFTALGLAEILRPRIHPPLHELLSGPHAEGLTALRRVAAEVAARPSWAPRLRAAPSVTAALRADKVALPDLARRAGRPLILQDNPALAPLGWVIEE